MRNGIKMNNLNSYAVKVNRYDIFMWFLFAYLTFYKKKKKKYLL